MITDRQRQILDYLRNYQQDQGVMPSTREIQHYFGFASQTAAVSHLRALEKRGFLHRLPNKARALVLADSQRNNPLLREIPLYGAIPAGYSETATEHESEVMTVDTAALGILPGAEIFALRVRGDSMINAHIQHGDLAILQKKAPTPEDIVAALIDGESTLKRYVLHKGVPFLKAENPDYPDLHPAQELQCQGVMVGLFRGRSTLGRS